MTPDMRAQVEDCRRLMIYESANPQDLRDAGLSQPAIDAAIDELKKESER